MRRIYESDALHRDDEDGFSPGERRDRSGRPLAARLFPSSWLSRTFLPDRLARRAIDVEVVTPREEYPLGVDVPFVVTMQNAAPFPVTLPTRSAVFWTWDVDGVTEASHVRLRDPPEGGREFTFERGERKTFRKRWTQTFRVSRSEWEPASPGEYTIGAGLNVEGAEETGLYDRTTVRILEE